MNRRQTSLFLLALAGCSTGQSKTLPPLLAPDDILVARNSRPLAELNDQTQLVKMTAFVNQRLTGWSVPWYGAPVGQIYFTFRKEGKPMGNFYVGPWFFGRDYGDFLSRSATKAEIIELERIASLPILNYVEGASK
jgi:hypothetical protein